MALVDRDEMTTLRSAADSKATAQTAEDDIQLQTVAYAINAAANTGQLNVEFKEALRENTKTQLASKGYTVTPVGTAVATDIHLISWK